MSLRPGSFEVVQHLFLLPHHTEAPAPTTPIDTCWHRNGGSTFVEHGAIQVSIVDVYVFGDSVARRGIDGVSLGEDIGTAGQAFVEHAETCVAHDDLYVAAVLPSVGRGRQGGVFIVSVGLR